MAARMRGREDGEPACVRAEVAVVGGGVIGLTTAFCLARAGVETVVVERGDVGAGASGACSGFLCLQSKKPGRTLELARESMRLYREFLDELGERAEFARTESLAVAQTAEEWRGLRAHVRRLKDAGVEVELLGKRDARQLEPELSERVMGASLAPGDARINPLKLLAALEAGCERLGVKMLRGCEVKNVERADRMLRVDGKSVVEARKVVLCAGAWTGELASRLGIRIGVLPRRGQVLVTERMHEMLRHPIITAGYLSAKFSTRRVPRAWAGSLSVEQSEQGSVLIGGVREFAGFDIRVSAGAMRDLAREAVELLPRLGGAMAVRCFAGLRPYTESGQPVMGEATEWPGLFVAAGHEGDGIALAPVTAKMVAKQIVTSG